MNIKTHPSNNSNDDDIDDDHKNNNSDVNTHRPNSFHELQNANLKYIVIFIII